MENIYCTIWTKDGKQELTKYQWFDFDWDKLHRLDGPAIEWSNGLKWWYVDGERHRLDGPAVEWSYGEKGWFINRKSNRLDGPAVEFSDGINEWWVDDKHLNTEEVEFWLKENDVDLSEPEGQMAFKLRWA